ncbi:MAG TPA: RecX family transcriptional regulator [Phycisphaerales bacterium]|nr:RecX family transcriptional regulator [Phycisphaerales bacterium]
MIVTRIGNPSRTGSRAVYAKAEGERTQKVATLNDQALADLRIEPGVAWTDRLAAKAQQASGMLAARRDAFRMIGARAVSRQRLIDRLRRKGHDATLAASVADEFVARGLIDDAAFAAVVAASASRRAGKRLVESKLRARGIDRVTAARASVDAAKERDALEDALTLGRGRLKRMSDRLTPDAKRRRLYGALARRGYDSDVCRTVVERLMRPGDDD